MQSNKMVAEAFSEADMTYKEKKMKEISEIAEVMQTRAWSIIKETKIVEIWSSIGARINLVGSLKTGLLINNRDIDFHIYTTPFKLSDSFLAISRLQRMGALKTSPMAT